jgi:multidrug resistance efflux pump
MLMSSPFSRTTRSLDADSYRRSSLGLIIVIIVLAAWTAWLLFARVSLYEVADTARLEVVGAVHPVQSPSAGRVVATHLAIGKQVKAGDILIELDSNAERLQLNEEQTRLAARSAELVALRDRGTAENQARIETAQGSPVALDEARARQRESEALARVAVEEVERLARLHKQGLVPEMELIRARAEAQKRQEAAEALRLGVERLDKEQQARASDRLVRVETVKGEIALLEGEINTRRATIERIKNEAERRVIRASASGRLGEVAELRVGSFVDQGQKLAAIIPEGTLKAVAEFIPSSAIGRVQTGQPALLRLAGFPWTEYGMVRATVASVASEPRDGRIRVELLLTTDPTSMIPLQHGLPGTVEVEVERVSPANLLLRAVGKRLTTLSNKAAKEGGRGAINGAQQN